VLRHQEPYMVQLRPEVTRRIRRRRDPFDVRLLLQRRLSGRCRRPTQPSLHSSGERLRLRPGRDLPAAPTATRGAAGGRARAAARIVTWVGAGIALLAGIIGGAALAGSWQQVLVWLHAPAFGATDPVLHSDYSFFVFTLPVIDAFVALVWAGVILGLLGALAVGFVAFVIENAPDEVPIPLSPPPGKTARDALHVAIRHAGISVVGIFLLAVAG